jgi:hypothetical protein
MGIYAAEAPMKYGIEEAFAVLRTGLARTLAVICKQLIDQGAPNEELLAADLAMVADALPK